MKNSKFEILQPEADLRPPSLRPPAIRLWRKAKRADSGVGRRIRHVVWRTCLGFSIFTSFVYAQDIPKKPPHGSEEVQTGIITGTLFADKKAPLPGHPVALEVLKGHELILSIQKETDPKGRYFFKNIFRAPDFFYAVSTGYNGRLYRTEFVSLGAKEQERKLDLYVGAGAREALPLPPPTPMDETSASGMKPVRASQMNEYQLLAVLLSICAIGLAILQKRRWS